MSRLMVGLERKWLISTLPEPCAARIGLEMVAGGRAHEAGRCPWPASAVIAWAFWLRAASPVQITAPDVIESGEIQPGFIIAALDELPRTA